MTDQDYPEEMLRQTQEVKVSAVDLAVALEAIRHVLRQGQPSPLPESLAQHDGLQSLLTEIATLQRFVLALAKGDLDQILLLRGLMAGGLKSLQAHLRHLTWQTQQVAKGDFSQHVDFMGAFSEAFNTMVDSMRESQANLKHRERELRDANADLRREIAERERIEQQIKRANANLQRRVKELSALNRITQAVATQTHLKDTLHVVIRETVVLFDALTGVVGLLDEERQGQTLVAVYNDDYADGAPEDAVYVPLDVDKPSRYVIETGEPLIIANMFEHPENEINRDLAHRYRIKSNMTTPLWARGEIIGTFSVARHESVPAFTKDEAKLAQTIAGQMAGAIANAKYLDELRYARDVAEHARVEAEAANQAKSMFLATLLSAKTRQEREHPVRFRQLKMSGGGSGKNNLTKMMIIDAVKGHERGPIGGIGDDGREYPWVSAR